MSRIKADGTQTDDAGSMIWKLTNGTDKRRQRTRRWSVLYRTLAVIVAFMLVLSPFAGGGTSHAMHGPAMHTTTDSSHGHDGGDEKLASCCHAIAACAGVFLITADQSAVPQDATAMMFEMINSLLEGRESVPDLQPPTT